MIRPHVRRVTWDDQFPTRLYRRKILEDGSLGPIEMVEYSSGGYQWGYDLAGRHCRCGQSSRFSDFLIFWNRNHNPYKAGGYRWDRKYEQEYEHG